MSGGHALKRLEDSHQVATFTLGEAEANTNTVTLDTLLNLIAK